MKRIRGLNRYLKSKSLSFFLRLRLGESAASLLMGYEIAEGSSKVHDPSPSLSLSLSPSPSLSFLCSLYRCARDVPPRSIAEQPSLALSLPAATFLRPAVINISRERRLVPAATGPPPWLDCLSNVSACMATLPLPACLPANPPPEMGFPGDSGEPFRRHQHQYTEGRLGS